jgi:hypothetical protein
MMADKVNWVTVDKASWMMVDMEIEMGMQNWRGIVLDSVVVDIEKSFVGMDRDFVEVDTGNFVDCMEWIVEVGREC